MGHKPVFQDKFEVSIWKKLSADVESSSKKAEYYTGIADSIIKREGGINSIILTTLIVKLYEIRADRFFEIMERLVAKSRPNDCSPALTAASIYAETDRLTSAERIVEKMVHCQDIPFLGCVKAKIYMKAGDTVNAKKELMRARCSDPGYPMFYELIQQLEPTEGWMHRRNIELLASGKEPIPCGDTGSTSAETLFGIYRDWYKGNKDQATNAMINSDEYKKKNSEYLLASARMSINERDWHSAQRMYNSILTKSSNCVYIICEAAKAHFFGGSYEQALSLYREAEAHDPASPNVLRGLIQTYSALGRKGEAAQCIQVFLNTEKADIDSFVAGASLLMENSMYDEAASILNRILISYPEDPSAFILKSEVEFREGNINAAMMTILNGVDKNPNDSNVRLQKAYLLRQTGKTEKAVKELQKIRTADPNNVGVLALLMSIASSEKNTNEAMSLANKIVELDPGNIEARNVISKGSLKGKPEEESYATYKNMVLEDNRSENLINILQSLISEKRYLDAVRLCNDKERDYGKLAMVKRLKGNAEYALKEYRAASISFAAATISDPLNPILWHSKGMADEAAGDLDHAEEAFNKAILLNMDEPEFWISRSFIQEKKNDIDGAVESMNKAIGLRPELVYALIRKGLLFAKVGRFEESIYFIDMALMIEPNNTNALRIQRDICFTAGDLLRAENIAIDIVNMDVTDPESIGAAVKVLSGEGKIDDAAMVIEHSLAADPTSIPLLLIKKEFHTFSGNLMDVINACERILCVQPDNDLVKSDLAEAYANAGDVTSANRIYVELKGTERKHIERSKPDVSPGKSGYKQKVPDVVKRYAERVLRKAYISRITLSDPDLVGTLDMDESTVNAVMAYLSDIAEYGDIVPGTLEFDRMESLSMNAIIKGGYESLEDDPMISIPCAYVAGGAKDADEAKMLVAYVYKALTVKVGTKSMTPELRKMALGIVKGTSIVEIMKKLKIGVYQANVIKSNL